MEVDIDQHISIETLERRNGLGIDQLSSLGSIGSNSKKPLIIDKE